MTPPAPPGAGQPGGRRIELFKIEVVAPVLIAALVMAFFIPLFGEPLWRRYALPIWQSVTDNPRFNTLPASCDGFGLEDSMRGLAGPIYQPPGAPEADGRSIMERSDGGPTEHTLFCTYSFSDPRAANARPGGPLVRRFILRYSLYRVDTARAAGKAMAQLPATPIRDHSMDSASEPSWNQCAWHVAARISNLIVDLESVGTNYQNNPQVLAGIRRTPTGEIYQDSLRAVTDNDSPELDTQMRDSAAILLKAVVDKVNSDPKLLTK